MQNRISKYFLTGLVILIIVSLTGCLSSKKQPNPEDEDYEMRKPQFDIENMEDPHTHILVKYVSAVVSEIILPTDPIRIKFVSNMVKSKELGQEEKKHLFTFSPGIKGQAIWKDRRTLEFIPENPLQERTSYSAKIDINELIEEDVKILPYRFSFRVAGREITLFEADFEAQNNKQEELKYTGRIKFSLLTNLDELKKAFSLKLKRKKIQLNWEGEDQGYELGFSSEIIKRDDSLKNFKLTIPARSLNLSEDFEREFSLETLHEMKVVQILRKYEQVNPGVEIEFSDELDLKQDVNGLIVIEPDIQCQLRKFGKKILVTGNFSFGNKYKITVTKGIQNIVGNKTSNEFIKEFSFNDQKPQISFSHDGIFLPSSNKRKLSFLTLNVKQVNLRIDKVFESNLCFFLQDQKLESGKNKSDFNTYRMRKVGIEVVNEKLEIGEIRNKWLQHELDLHSLIPVDEKGLFLVKISFSKNDILYRAVSNRNNNRYHNYYSDPNNDGYYHRNGMIYKPIILSDIGLTYKKTAEKHIIFASDIITTKPLNNCEITLRTYQDQVIDKGTTNSNGKIEFPVSDESVFYLEAENDGQRSIIKPNEMGWNLSTFDVEGIKDNAKGIRAFIYTERGVYRPGDEINISMIFRNNENTFPDDHPVKIRIFNPKNQKILDTTIKKGVDGFYKFPFRTQETDMTGNWRLQVEAGSGKFSHTLKIETVVAERLKVLIEPEKEVIKVDDLMFKAEIQANYLFGNAASGLNALLKAEIFHQKKKFDNKKFSNYSFNNATIDLKDQKFTLFEEPLDNDGHGKVNWEIPDFSSAPSSLIVKLEAEITEKGGRSSKKKIFLPIDPYEYYVGIESNNKSYVKIGKPNKFNFILLDDTGKEKTGEELIVRIYRNNNYWWWEFDDRNKARLHFKADVETELLREISVRTTSNPVNFEYTAERYGEYLIEVSHKTKTGIAHISSQFFNAFYWGRSDVLHNAGVITLKTDKPVYYASEKAEVTFPIPPKSRILVSLERDDRVLKSYWYKPEKRQTSGKISIPITDEMMPNIYCSIAVIQPHEQTDNDRPFRLFGVIPIKVEDNHTRQEIELNVPEKLHPNEKFSCKIQTKGKIQFTIAVVDEGLLSLTDFRTPDPWKEFYKKIRLGVQTFDNFAYIIGANKGDVYKIFSVGGDYDQDTYRKSQQASVKAKRFKPVCLFEGPLETDKNGFAEVEFEMPEYIGAVRIMVISARNGCYGKAEKTVPVKNELMILPTLPRVLAPGDKFEIPVEVFAMEEGIRNVEVTASVTGPTEIVGNSRKSLIFDKMGEKTVFFQAKALSEVGIAKIIIKAESEKYNTENSTDIAIRSYSPRIYQTEEKKCSPGNSITFLVPGHGLKGTNNASLNISRHPKADIGKRIDWLIRYPYGCIEQTTSSVFPQLYLKNFLKKSDDDEESIDHNINSAIKRLRKFQLPNGSFSYWPGRDEPSDWGTNYAGHFLIEAKNLGYFVPQDMLANWIRYQQGAAKKNNNKNDYINKKYRLKTQLYRLYLLALAGKPDIGSMNYQKEDVLTTMDDTERWMLAAAYELAGIDETSEIIANKTGMIVRDYTELAETFGSGLRDKAIILDALITMKRSDMAEKLYLDITGRLSSKDWFSTQTIGYSLLSLGKYIQANKADFNQNSPLKGKIILADNEIIPFDSHDFSVMKIIKNSFGKNITIEVDKSTELSNLYLTLNWDGIPLNPTVNDFSNGLNLQTTWLDPDGNLIDPIQIKQGQVFKAKIRIEKSLNRTLNNIALVQILPSGWEVENERINPDEFSNDFTRNEPNYKTGKVDYLDIRDDRVMWFFDLRKNQKQITLEITLRAVTVGEFQLPPTLCEVMYDNKFKCLKSGYKVNVLK